MSLVLKMKLKKRNKTLESYVGTTMKSCSSFLLSFLALSMLVFDISSARAEYIEPGKVVVETSDYKPAKRDFDRGTYHYEISWQGLPVAKAQIVVGEATQGNRLMMNVKASAKTGDFIDVFYRLRFSSESLFEAESFRPVRFESYQKENSREKLREVTFGPDGSIKADYVKNGEQRPPISFKSENATFDPISAAFLARSLPLNTGDSHSFDVFNGKHRYLISFEVKGLEVLTLEGKEYRAYKVIPLVQKLTDSEGEKRLKKAAIWISADDSREVLKLESKVLVGKVNAKLVRFEPEAPKDPVVQVEMAKAAF